jgi:biotin-[acetyl-CoA-carboxylase] ligase BirA-like protein
LSADAETERLQKSPCTRRLGKRIFFKRQVHSTNSWAKELAENGAEEGTVTVAATQTAGRGRLGRRWISPRGGLWFSIILKPKLKPREVSKVVFAASLAVAEVLHENYRLKTEVKWPNDVLVSGKKICGILAETATFGEDVKYVVIGIGVNANFSIDDVLPESVKAASTSIQDELDRKVRLNSLLRALLSKIEITYDQCMGAGFAVVLERWKTYAQFLGNKVSITDQNETLTGVASDIDIDGALIVTLRDGTTKRIVTGDLFLRR